MPSKRIEMDKIYEIQRPKKLGHSKAEVARIVGINRETVAQYWNQESPQETNSPHWAKQIDSEYLKSELKREVSRRILYEELATSASMPSYKFIFQFAIRISKFLIPWTRAPLAWEHFLWQENRKDLFTTSFLRKPIKGQNMP